MAQISCPQCHYVLHYFEDVVCDVLSCPNCGEELSQRYRRPTVGDPTRLRARPVGRARWRLRTRLLLAFLALAFLVSIGLGGTWGILTWRTADKERARLLAEREDTLTKWDRAIAKTERLLADGDVVRADQTLVPVEAEMNSARDWQGSSEMANRATALLEQAARLRKEVTEISRDNAWMRSVLERAISHLDKSDFEEALRVLKQAPEAGGPDPILESAAAYVSRIRTRHQLWDPGHTNELMVMAENSTLWRKTRRQNTTAGYVAFLKKNPSSPFAREAKTRLLDLEVPPSGEDGDNGSRRSYSVIHVYNETTSTLTVHYNGADSFTATFAPREAGALEVLVGTYHVTCSADTSKANTINSIEETFKSTGEDYQIRYSIISFDRPEAVLKNFRPSTPTAMDFLRAASREKLPTKRSLPEYLK